MLITSIISICLFCVLFGLQERSEPTIIRRLHLDSLMLKRIPDTLAPENCRVNVPMFVLINELTKDLGFVKKRLPLVQNTKSAKYHLHSAFLLTFYIYYSSSMFST